ncbi:hypothetical protein CBM2634_B160027 [Cupriavidus taiwanensis]|uniref:Uncharacterized protein n=1 Tax=Cupriavidus taiwanensis TaxID=164546 RepID=A0A375J6F7_9BURK|nr:hypothetical protein CBM2634_B160027 [Cupriavidus taiwanensis]
MQSRHDYKIVMIILRHKRKFRLNPSD